MARFPTGPYKIGATGCYKCARRTRADGSCGIHPYPCVHYGLDLYPVDDLTVVAPEDGIVTDVSDGKSAPFRGYGPGVVMIKGDSGYYHLLSHLGELGTTPGARVTEGEPVGKIDAGVKHTHYEVRRQRTGTSVTNTMDPGIWLRRNRAAQVAFVDVRGAQVWTTIPIMRDTFDLPPPSRWRGPVLTSLAFAGGLALAVYFIERDRTQARLRLRFRRQLRPRAWRLAPTKAALV